MSEINTGIGQTDVVFPEVRLYIEGIQVPFLSIQITSGVGSLPTASMQLPPQSGLMEIAHFYQPKVHIFYIDQVTQEECVLFNGLITGVSYEKSAHSPGSTSIAFQCMHRNTLLNQVTLDYTGYASDSNPNLVSPNFTNAAVKVPHFASIQSIEMALAGIDTDLVGGPTEVTPENVRAWVANQNLSAAQQSGSLLEPNPATVPEFLDDYKNRLIGFPGALVNFWNQLKRIAFQDSLHFEFLNRLYIPLVEGPNSGLKYFQRMSGYYYIEKLLNDDKIDPCTDQGVQGAQTQRRMTPAAFRIMMKSAVQTSITSAVINSMTRFSGELTSLVKVFYNFFVSIDYDMVTLTSPSIVPKDPTDKGTLDNLTAMETLVKPQLPFYYSPVCNLILPNMYSSISVTQDEAGIPTRITATNDLLPGGVKLSNNYRAPASIREAIARGLREVNNVNPDKNFHEGLLGTTKGVNNKVGKYEQGRGVLHTNIMMPNWLSLFGQAENKKQGSDGGTPPAPQDADAELVARLSAAWEDRYGVATKVDAQGNKTASIADPSVLRLNPWSSDADIFPFQRILFGHADYIYSQSVAQAKQGSLEGPFNPYIIPGHPMDILDPSPTKPSFHAYCNVVTHTITARSIGTSIGFSSAFTYTELANYYVNFVHPWLLGTLKITNKTGEINPITGKDAYTSSIVRNADAKAIADQIYIQTFAVPAVAPEDVYNFSTGEILPVQKVTETLGIKPGSASSVTGRNGGELNPNLTVMGSMSLVYRPIETRDMIERTFGLKFVEMKASNYNPTVVRYTDSSLTNSELLEPGASQFLEYDPLFNDTSLNGTAKTAVTESVPSDGSPPIEDLSLG